MTACRYHKENGTLTYLSGLSTVSDSHVGSKYPAAIRIHPGGNYLYVSTRGENSCLTVFKVDAGGGLERIQVLDKVPAWPREFNLDPSGKILLIAGERSDEIALYHINEETGKLSGGTSRVTLPAPASILFIE